MSKKIYGQELINSLNEELKRISNLRIKRLDQDVSECGLSNYFDNIRESEIKRQLNILKNEGLATVKVLVRKDTGDIVATKQTKFNHWIVNVEDEIEGVFTAYVNMNTKKYKKEFEVMDINAPAWIQVIYSDILGSAPSFKVVASDYNYFNGKYNKIAKNYIQ